jgi:restriction system protein
VQNAKSEYQKALKQYKEAQQAFEQKVQQRNQEVTEFEKAYQEGDPSAISAYCTMVLERSEYPDGFPQEFRVAYVPESKQLVIEYELPNAGIVPHVAEYKYVKTKDNIEEKARKVSDIKTLYQDIVASVCLRTVHEVFEADQGKALDVVVFNGFTQAVDPATGRDIRPHLISLRVTRERFDEIDLSRVDKQACLRNLGAQVSSKPDEMLPVKPIVEFKMVDKRFVEQSDVLADLESRPNLMDLTPFEFENLVSNLFSKMGFETKQTRSSKDGGVDAVAYDTRPILGGKVVIQAKRYKNTVGVSAVRDLYGTMINEGANKGILVATSSYGPDAYDFSKDKPIELIDGGGLLYLLDENGVQARIVFPDD